MSSILIIGTFEAIFLIVLLLGKKRKYLPDLFLGIMLFLLALSIGFTYVELYNAKNGYPFPMFINLSWLLLFLHGPALWFYIKSFSYPSLKFKPVYFLHFIPFLVFFGFHYFDFIHLPAQEKIMLVKADLFTEKVFYKISILAIGMSTIGYYLWALKLIRQHRTQLMQRFSKIEKLDLNWLRILIVASLCCYGVNVALFILDLIFHFASHRFLMFVAYSFGSVYIFVLGYFGILQGRVFVDLTTNNQQSLIQAVIETENLKKEDDDTDSSFASKLLLFMESNQPYLDPEITLEKLSNQLKVKPEYLSGILNSSLNYNFFDFINKHRIEEFKIQSLKSDNSHLSIMGLAYNCGFNSKASFYRAFNKFEGISPSAYIQRVSK